MDKKRVLVTGSNGLLGQKLTNLYMSEDSVELIATGRGENRHSRAGEFNYEAMDISSADDIARVFAKWKPDAVIHGAAMTHVDQCELNPDDCELYNVTATKLLIEASEKIGLHFIFVSTDFIFDGENGPYKEDDQANPLSIYGHSKLNAERIVRSYSHAWSIARTVLVYGLNDDMSRSNIVLWAKSSLESGKEMDVVDDQVRSPTLAEDLAKGCYLIERQAASGIFNISGKDNMTIFELVQRVADYFGLSTENVKKIDSKSLGQPAKRPPITGFDLTKSRQVLSYEPRSFEEGISLIIEQFEKRSFES